MPISRHTLAAVLCLLCGGMAHAALQTLTCDFLDGIPADWTVYDLDLNTPSKSAASRGFEAGKGWIAIAPDGENNRAACSTSWYSPSGTADDWLVTPAIAAGASTVLEWRSKCSDPKYADGLSVYVSTTGNSPADFTGDPVFSVNHETGSWTSHSVDLSAYSGETLWIAFVNDSDNCSCLYVDDIYVGQPHCCELTIELSAYTPEPRNRVKGRVSNISDTPVEGFTVDFFAAGSHMSQTFGATVLPGDYAYFEFDTDLELMPLEFTEYSASLLIDGRLDHQTAGNTICIPRKTVVEEATGAWCAYCVGGRVALKRMTEKYPDLFIGIAVQNADMLTLSHYDSYLGSAFHVNSYPTAILNRTSSLSISDLYEAVDKAITLPTPAHIGLDVTYDPVTRDVQTDCHTLAAVDLDGPLAIAIVAIEDGISMPGLVQSNAYSGSGLDMDGWEDLPSVVTSETKPFDHVARYISAFYGNEDSTMASITKGPQPDYSFSFNLPSEVLDPNRVHIVALLLDKSSKAIINADIRPLISGGSGIAPCENDEIDRIEYFDIAGRPLSSPVSKGICLMRTTYADGRSISRTIVR